MEILPPLQATLNLVAFLANLIDLNQSNTILVLHDQNHRDQVNLIIENLQPRYDVAWILVNEFKNLKNWNHAIIKDKNILILTAVQQQNIVPLLMPLYNTGKLNPSSKNLIVISDFSKLAIKTLPRIQNHQQINAVLVDSTLAEVKIYAWNPKKGEKSIVLNETEFLCASNAALTNRKYSGVFFDQLQSFKGQETIVMVKYDTRHVYNVISKDSVAGIDGTVIRMVDIMGEAIQSPIQFSVFKMFTVPQTRGKFKTIIYTDYIERTYKTFESVPLRQFQIISGIENITTYLETVMYSESHIVAGGIIGSSFKSKVYPHGIENNVIIVENNTTITATAIERIFTNPVIYFWMLLIFVFVVFRCGLQWLCELYVTDTARKRQRCITMCQDTVQLSCGVVMNTKIFQSGRYGHTMLAHGATIIPLVAGMFLSGLLYGEYLIHSEVPNIDSIEQLEQSNLTIYGLRKSRLKNEFVQSQHSENLNMIWSGDTRYAYVIPERWTSILNMDHLQRNGRPLFHVVKEPYDVFYPSFIVGHWYQKNRLDTIVMRLQEYGFVNYFESISKRISNEMPSNNVDLNTLVAEAGGLQELLIACVIYLVGMLCGILVFILELFSKRTSK